MPIVNCLTQWLRHVHHLRNSRVGPWLRDVRGSAVVQFVLITPILLAVVFGSLELWKVVAIKQVLKAGTIRAARYLLAEGNSPFNTTITPRDVAGWQQAAKMIVERELGNLPVRDLRVRIIAPDTGFELYGKPSCPEPTDPATVVGQVNEALFAVEASVTISTPLRIPYTDVIPPNLRLREVQVAYIECEPFLPLPTPTPGP